MSKGPIQEIKRILDDDESPDWKRSAQTLERTFVWVMETIREVQAESRAKLLLALSGLSQAMGTGIAGMKGLGPIIEQVQSGPTLKTKIAQNEKSLKQLMGIIHSSTEELSLLEQQEIRYKKLEAEKAELDNRLRWIEKHKNTDEKSVNSLRDEVTKIYQTKTWLKELDVIEGNLLEDLPAVLTLSDSTVKLMDETTRQELQTLEQNCQKIQQGLDHLSEMRKTKEIESKKLNDELNAEQKRFENIDRHQEQLNEVLKKYAQADHQLAESLNTEGAKSVEDILKQVDNLLKKTDEILRDAMDANAAANQIQRFPL